MNILQQPKYVPRGYSISEYDISSGILKPSTIPIQIAQKLPIQRQSRVELPQVNLSTLDTRMDLLKEKMKNDPYYNQQPQLIKLPEDTRISASGLLKKGKTLYDLYNKIEKVKSKARSERKDQLPVAPPSDGDTIDRSEFPPADNIPMGIPVSPPDDEGKHDTDKPPAPSRPAPTRPEVFDPTIQTTEQPSISVIQGEVKDTSERGRVRPSRDLPEPETFDPTPQGVVPSISDVEQEDTTREWINNWVGRFDRIEEDPADYSDDWDDLHPVVDHPSTDVFEPRVYNRPIQAIDQFGESFFIPSITGEPSMRPPEQQLMDDDDDVPVNIWM